MISKNTDSMGIYWCWLIESAVRREDDEEILYSRKYEIEGKSEQQESEVRHEKNTETELLKKEEI